MTSSSAIQPKPRLLRQEAPSSGLWHNIDTSIASGIDLSPDHKSNHILGMLMVRFPGSTQPECLAALRKVHRDRGTGAQGETLLHSS